MKTKSRPKHLNLIKVRMPITAIASIFHRLSGALLFLATPFLLYILTASLKSNSGFELARQWLDSIFIKLCLVVLIWSAVHHFLAGIRYLVLDLDMGLDRRSANLSAMAVTALGLFIAIMIVMQVL